MSGKEDKATAQDRDTVSKLKGLQATFAALERDYKALKENLLKAEADKRVLEEQLVACREALRQEFAQRCAAAVRFENAELALAQARAEIDKLKDAAGDPMVSLRGR